MTQLKQTDSLVAGEKAAAAVAVAPRVSLDDITANIAEVHYAMGIQIANCAGQSSQFAGMDTLTVCCLVTQSGYVVIGQSNCADPANFNAELGRKFAYEDAVRQLWPLMGYHLRQTLHLQKAL